MELVIGGGRSGVEAARRHAEGGREVVLVDELAAPEIPGVEVIAPARALGVYEGGLVPVDAGEVLYRFRAEEIVVGLPLTLRGERGEQARVTERFAAALRKVVDVPVVLFDERFTTDLAQQTPSDTPEDARAAAHLLSGYLEWSSRVRP